MRLFYSESTGTFTEGLWKNYQKHIKFDNFTLLMDAQKNSKKQK
jgi:hypothetical protein